MPVALFPQAVAEVSSLPITDGLQLSPPIAMTIGAEQFNQESGSTLDGRIHRPTREAQPVGKPIMQDTYLPGTSGVSGSQFNVVTGGAGWTNVVMAWSNKNAVMFDNGTAGSTFEILEATSTAGLDDRMVCLVRGVAPPDAAHDRQTVTTYLELASGSDSNYRIAFEWGAPPRLDYYDPAKKVWVIGVDVCTPLGNIENYLDANNREIRLHICPDIERNILRIELGSQGHHLQHSPPRPTNAATLGASTPLPAVQRYRLTGQNGWLQFQVFPYRYGSVSATKAPMRMPKDLPNVANASVMPTGNGKTESSLRVNGSVAQDAAGNLTFQATAQLPDAGDGLGSKKPPSFAGIFIYIPPQWSDPGSLYVPGGNYYDVPPLMHVEERQTWDDVLRLASSSCRLTVNNRYGRYTGNYGNFSFNLSGSNGYTVGQRMRGIIADGFTTHQQDPMRIMQCIGHDKGYTLGVPIGQEIILDGWAWPAAVRLVCGLGQIHDSFLLTIPQWAFGPANEDCPYYILGRGTGNQPKHRYGAEATPLQILLDLVQDVGFLDSYGRYIPAMMGFDIWGQFHFEAWDVRNLPLVRRFSDQDPSGFGQISEMTVYDSIEDLRTELIFQGQDAWTNELLHYHLPLPQNLAVIGFRRGWVEREERWATPAYLERLLYNASIQASLPSQTVRIKVPYDPLLSAGSLVYVESYSALGRGGLFVVTDLYSRYGILDWQGQSGYQECYSWLTARSAENYLSF